MRTLINFFYAPLYFIFSLFQLLGLRLISPKKIQKIYQNLDAKEEEKRIESMTPYTTKGDQLLDVGAGSGRFGKAVQDRLGVWVTGVDVCDYSDHSIPFSVYNGKKLPFPDKSFDVVFFAFVLHHVQSHETLLEEAVRVSRKKIVVFEDTYDHFWERWFTCWNDYHTNILQGKIKSKKGVLRGDPTQMPMPFTFRSVQGWEKFFQKFPIKLAFKKVRHSGYKPLQKVTFCLEQLP